MQVSGSANHSVQESRHYSYNSHEERQIGQISTNVRQCQQSGRYILCEHWHMGISMLLVP
jgi:hypothetical protein